jgi:hypothetical protein
MGCICPPTSEKTCESRICPRKDHLKAGGENHEGDLQVRKKVLPMSDAAYLDQAANWSKDLTRMKARGPGDTENAMRQIEREYGIDYGFLWSLRYRRDRLKIISLSVYESIRAAYREECERQCESWKMKSSRTEQIAGPDSAAVRAAKALVGEAVEAPGLFRMTAAERDQLVITYLETGSDAARAMAIDLGVSPRYVAKLLRQRGIDNTTKRGAKMGRPRDDKDDPRWQWAIQRGAVIA